jgi:MFS family permease
VPAAERGWTSATTLSWGTGAIALLGAFVLREARTAAPLVPLRVFRSRTVVGANAIQTIGAAGMFGSFFLGSLYLQQVLGYRPLEIGLAFLPVTVLMGTLSVRYSERLVTRFGAPAVMVPGLVLVAAGLAGLAMSPTNASLVGNVLPPMLLLGAGAGLCFPALMTLAMTGVAAEDAGLASGLVNATGQVGGAVGLAVLATVSSSHAATLTARGVAPLDALTGGFHAAFWTAAGLVLVALAVAVVLSRGAWDALPDARAAGGVDGGLDGGLEETCRGTIGE